MTSILDEKRRIVLPKDLAEELGLMEGSKVSFSRDKGGVIVRKVEGTGDPLREMMSWNPKRKGKPKPVKEGEIKEVWKTH